MQCALHSARTNHDCSQLHGPWIADEWQHGLSQGRVYLREGVMGPRIPFGLPGVRLGDIEDAITSGAVLTRMHRMSCVRGV